MRRILTLTAACLVALAGCSSGSGGGPSPSPTAAPVITELAMKAAVHCTGGDVPVEVTWTTQGAQSAALSVDGARESKNLDPSGSATVNVTCNNETHEVMLTAVDAAGQTADETHRVRTVKGQPTTLPVIDAFTVTTGQCDGSTLAVSAQYRTTGATTVAFDVDGQAPGAQAGLETSGAADVPDVPCDGKSHQITLVATNADGQSVQATQYVKGAATPVITDFSVAGSVHCQGSEVEVKVAWQSTGARSAAVALDGGIAARDLPASGSTTISVPCRDGSQKIGLVVSANDGKQASVVHSVTTIPSGGGTEPVIDSFTLEAPGCQGSTVKVKAAYRTSNAESVAFEVDGEDPGMQAGLPTSGRAKVPDVPCDGKAHQVTLLATSSSDRSVQQTRTVGPLFGSQ
ncbi:MAG: hypothetical protein U0R23_06195 [Candidatus Nanopelagicales bacterium]